MRTFNIHRQKTLSTPTNQTMKIIDAKIKEVNNVGQIGNVSFPLSGGVTTAHIAYTEGASNMAKMFREAIQSGDLKKLLELSSATETDSFYKY